LNECLQRDSTYINYVVNKLLVLRVILDIDRCRQVDDIEVNAVKILLLTDDIYNKKESSKY